MLWITTQRLGTRAFSQLQSSQAGPCGLASAVSLASPAAGDASSRRPAAPPGGSAKKQEEVLQTGEVERGFPAVTCGRLSASTFDIEPNGGIFDVSPENDRASPNVKTLEQVSGPPVQLCDV